MGWGGCMFEVADNILVLNKLTMWPVADRRQAMSFSACLSMLYLPPRLCRHISLCLRTKPHMESASARCEPFQVFLLLPGAPTCPAWLSAAPVASRCEPFSPNRLTPASRDRPGAFFDPGGGGLSFDDGYRDKFRDDFHEVGLVCHDLVDVLVGSGRLLQITLPADGVDDALSEFEGRDENLSRRTVQADIQMMRSDKLGYNAPIVVKENKYYTHPRPSGGPRLSRKA